MNLAFSSLLSWYSILISAMLTSPHFWRIPGIWNLITLLHKMEPSLLIFFKTKCGFDVIKTGITFEILAFAGSWKHLHSAHPTPVWNTGQPGQRKIKRNTLPVHRFVSASRQVTQNNSFQPLQLQQWYAYNFSSLLKCTVKNAYYENQNSDRRKYCLGEFS